MASSLSFILYQKYSRLKQLVSDPSLINKEEARNTISKVSRLMELPTDEEPTVATVADLEQLKNKPFFQKAKLGDKVLIYTKAKKAILYDPKSNKIIDVGPITFEPSVTPTVSVFPSPSPSVVPTIKDNLKIILFNGTTVTGLTKTYEDQLKEKIPELTVVDTDVANKRDYQESLLVDLTGNNQEQARLIASTLGIKVDELPPGETASPSADFLIILGSDKNNL